MNITLIQTQLLTDLRYTQGLLHSKTVQDFQCLL